MEIISIDKDVFNALSADIETIAAEAALFAEQEDLSLRGWLDNEDVCQVLNISKRTLQTYRDNGAVPYSRIENKIYYKAKDIQKVLNSAKH